jgi:hypothetical protein
MAKKLTPILSTFAGGEVDPWIYGRQDLQRYYNSVKTMLNAIALPTGGFMRRSGFCFIVAAKEAEKAARLVSFEYNVDQSYILEFGDLYMRVFTRGDSVTMTDLTTVYTEDELHNVKYSQVGDVMYLCHSDHPTQKLIRLAEDDWTIEDAPFIWGPFLDINTTDTTLAPSATSGSITVTASDPVFEEAHIGSLWLIMKSDGQGAGGYVEITDFTSDTVVTADVVEELGGVAASVHWAEGQFSDVRGYPRGICFFQDRMMLAGTNWNPHTVWGSVSGEIENFAEGTDDDAALDYPLWASTKDVIHWMASLGYGIYAGTAQGVFRVTGGGVDTPMTPTNVVASYINSERCSHEQGIVVGNRVMYISRDGRRVRELLFNFAEDSYGSTDMNYLSYHVTEGGANFLTWQQDPNKVLWATTGNGELIGMTYDPKESVAGWHRHTTDGVFKSIAVAHQGEESHLYALIERTVDGKTVKYIEYMCNGNGDHFSDSHLDYSGVATSTMTGLDHLKYKTVTANLDGATHPLIDVDHTGTVEFNVATEVATVGLPYTTLVETLPLDIMQAPLATALTSPQGWREIVIRLNESQIPTVNGERHPVRKPEHGMGVAPPLVSGLIWTNSVGWGYDGTISIEASDPLPCQVSAVMGRLELGG